MSKSPMGKTLVTLTHDPAFHRYVASGWLCWRAKRSGGSSVLNFPTRMVEYSEGSSKPSASLNGPPVPTRVHVPPSMSLVPAGGFT
jgi:hypothetical protein